jgi:tetratricopeptide (TPR) repeat protein
VHDGPSRRSPARGGFAPLLARCIVRRSVAARCRPVLRTVALCFPTLCILTQGCAEYASTTRIVNGREIVGRSISPEAYSAYARGMVFEARGKPQLAVRAYRAALEADPDAVEVQAALARASCSFAPDRADEEFATAAELDPSFEPTHRDWARCLLARKRPLEAIRHARDAFRATPAEWPATEVLVDALESAGRHREAARYLWGFAALAPWDPRPLERISGRPRDSLHAEPAPDPLRIALRDGEDGKAVSIALERRMNDVTLARFALEEARPDFALSRSQLVLSADPRNSDARIVVLLAAFVLEEGRAYRSALRDLWRDHTLPSPAHAKELAMLLRVKVGEEAATLFLAAHGEAVLREVETEPRGPLPHELWQESRATDTDASNP